MFALIETNGATHIAIHIPKDGADKTLPAIASMLEQNATFIRKGWNEAETVTPSMGITLGNIFSIEGSEQTISVVEAGEVIGDDFVVATPDVFVSNKEAIKRKDSEIQRLRNELAATNDKLAALREQVEAVAEGQD